MARCPGRVSLALLLTLSPAGAAVLVRDGKPLATLVVSERASQAALYAANDLQSVIRSMTGATLPIATDRAAAPGNRVLIGETRFTDALIPPPERTSLGQEGYVVRLRGRDLALVGGGPYGTIYAAAELYERLGARWYMPGPLGACIPHLKSISFDSLDVTRRPSFAMRYVGKDPQWNLRNRTNYMPESYEGLPPAFTVYSGIYHTQEHLLPHSRYFKTNPEFYALIKGQRSKSPTSKLCNSNPDVAAELARNLANDLLERPDINLLSLSPTDGQEWCECDECKKLDEDGVPRDQKYSRRQMILYNRVAEDLEKLAPNRTLLTGAYNVYTWPPRDPEIHAHRNLAVVICHYEDYCMVHPVNDPNCKRNVKYLELIRAWQKQTPHLYFYDYYYKVNWMDLPWPIVHSIAADIPFFHSIGVEGLYTQWSDLDIWSNFLDHYVAARLLWDHTADVPKILDEFYVKFYGEAAAPMKQYHEALENRFAKTRSHVPGDAQLYSPALFSKSFLEELRGYLKQAGVLAKAPLVKRRLEKINVSLDYTARLVEFFRLGQHPQTIPKAVEVAEALQRDIQKDPQRYSGVVSGHHLLTKTGIVSKQLAKYRATLSK